MFWKDLQIIPLGSKDVDSQRTDSLRFPTLTLLISQVILNWMTVVTISL